MFFDSYSRNLNDSMRELAKGNLTKNKKGLKLILKDGSTFKGELSSETEEFYILKVKTQTAKVKKDLVTSKDEISIRVTSGTVGSKQVFKHES